MKISTTPYFIVHTLQYKYIHIHFIFFKHTSGNFWTEFNNTYLSSSQTKQLPIVYNRRYETSEQVRNVYTHYLKITTRFFLLTISWSQTRALRKADIIIDSKSWAFISRKLDCVRHVFKGPAALSFGFKKI